MDVRRLSAVIGIILLLIGAVACKQSTQQVPAGAPQIMGAGATFPYPLYKKWIEEYKKKNPDVNISYESVGSGEGIRKFLKDEVDFGASDAAMNDEQIARVARGVQLIPATAGIIVLAYNLKELSGPLKLKRDVYADIFRGVIKRWNDPRIEASNPTLTLPDKEIRLVARQDSSGTTYAFTNHLSAISDDWRDRGPGTGKVVDWPGSAMVAKGNEGVAARIKITEGAIGYVEYGFAERAGLSMAWLENKAGQIIQPQAGSGSATLANTQEDMPANLRMFFPDPTGESSYPIVTYSWLMVYRTYPNAKKANLIKDFIQWGLTSGQDYSESLGYSRLPARVVDMARDALKQLG
jgi:phosphate transport system substrate-binding protein